jgi:hypothetical protein
MNTFIVPQQQDRLSIITSWAIVGVALLAVVSPFIA